MFTSLVGKALAILFTIEWKYKQRKEVKMIHVVRDSNKFMFSLIQTQVGIYREIFVDVYG